MMFLFFSFLIKRDNFQLSAQESRRKRKEYMDALEKRIHYYRTENSTLKLKVF